jgi:hypothetical protein
VAFSMAWPQEAVQEGQGPENGRAGRFAASCTGASGSTGTRCRRCAHGRGAVAGAGVPPRARRGVKALNRGQVQVARLRWALAALPMPTWDDGWIRLAVDVSNWLRPDAATSAERLFCHCYARARGNAQMTGDLGCSPAGSMNLTSTGPGCPAASSHAVSIAGRAACSAGRTAAGSCPASSRCRTRLRE